MRIRPLVLNFVRLHFANSCDEAVHYAEERELVPFSSVAAGWQPALRPSATTQSRLSPPTPSSTMKETDLYGPLVVDS